MVLPITAQGDDQSQTTKQDASLMQSINSIAEPNEYLLEKQLAEKPDDKALRLQYATVLLDHRKIKESIAEYDRVLKVDAKNSEALIGTGCCYDRLGNWQDSLRKCREACEASPLNADAVISYVTEANKHGKIFEALPFLRTLARFDKPRAAMCYWWAAARIVSREYIAAQQYAKQAHELDPKNYPNEGIPINWSHFDKAGRAIRELPSDPWMRRFYVDITVKQPAVKDGKPATSR